jgi:hypothetical protein
MGNLIDTAVTNQTTGRYYFFRGDQYVRYEGGVGVDAGYPAHINGWNNLWQDFPGPYDAACHRATSTSQYFFFKDEEYVLYEAGTGGGVVSATPSYPRPIKGNWTGLYEALPPPYDAVVVGTQNGKYYFFKGSQFVRYVGGSGVDYGPEPIDTDWHGLYTDFPGPYDAVIASTSVDGDYYFFKGGRYAKYKRDTGVYDEFKNSEHNGRSIRYMWPGVWRLGDYMGPMLGSSSAGEDPKIWVWTRKLFNLTLKSPPSGITIARTASRTLSDVPGTYAQEWSIRGLAAGAVTPLTFKMDVNETNYHPISYEWPLPISKAPAAANASNVTIAFGSCLDDVRQNPRFALIPSLEKIRTLNPNIIIMGGDTTYYVNAEKTSTKPEKVKLGDMQDRLHMVMRQATTRNHPSVLSLLQEAPIVSTWDDHDFGFDNADSESLSVETSITKAETTNIFKSFWANTYRSLDPGYTGPVDTLEQRVRWGKVEIFIPDCRTHREPGKVLGDTQCQRLINGMRYPSGALVKILVLSSQLIPSRKDAEGENSSGFIYTSKSEREEIIDALSGVAAHSNIPEVPGVTGKILILSGDVHFHELTSWTNYGGNKIHELTTSPLLVKDKSLFDNLGLPYPPKPTNDDNDTRLWSSSGEGFALIKISFVNNVPTVTLEWYIMNETALGYDPRADNIVKKHSFTF